MSDRRILGSIRRIQSSTRRRDDVLRRAVWVAPEILESRTLLSGAPVLGVHFGADYNNGAGGTLAPTDTAGVDPMSNWNSESGTTGTATLTNAQGASSGASVGWQTNDVWGSGGQDQFTNPGDQKLMQGYLDHNGGTAAAPNKATTASLTSGTLDGDGILFTGLTGSSYDVVVYSLRDGNGPISQITVTGTNSDTETINPTAGGSYVLGKNYTIFLGMHPQNGSLLITPDGVSVRVPMNGVELLQPATSGVSAPTGLTATLGANGTTANLSFSAAGSNADALQIQRATSASGPFTTLTTVGPSTGTINYADNGLLPGQSYFYKVVALNSFNGGSQATSTTATVTTPALQTPALGVHFGSDYNNGAGGTLAPTDTAGVDPMSNWNNESGITGTAALTNAQGASSGASVGWQTNDVWGSGGQDQFTNPGDQKLMQGYLDHNGGTAAAPNKATTASLTSGTLDGDGILFTGLTGSSYDVVVYSLRDGNGPTSQITVTGTNSDTETITPTAGGSYVRGQNYSLFLGMHPQNGSLLITPDGVSFRVPMNGVELLQSASAAPAAPTNLTAAVSGASIGLNWTENGSNAIEYVVERGAAQAGPFTTIATLGPSSTTSGTYTDTSVLPGIMYYYRVGAVNSFNGGTEADSNVAGPVVIAATNSTKPIGINFQSGNGAEFPLAPTAVAGAYPIAHWNNETLVNPPVQADGSMNSSGAITDSSGVVTNITASWFANNPWSSGGNDNFPAGPDHDLMEGYLDEWGFGANGGSNHHSATAASLSAGTLDGQGILLTNLNLSDYDVIVYSLGDGAGRIGTFTAIGSNSVSARNESEPSTTYVLGQNTAVLADVKPVNGKMLITFDDTTVRNPINGIELMPIATSAPTAVALAGTYDPANAAVNLTWTGGTSNTLENLVQRSTSANGPWTTVGAALPNATSFTDQIPLVGQNVYYRLVSTNSFNGGSNANSNVVGPFIVPAGSGAEAHYFPQAYWGGQPTVTQDVTTVNLNLAGGTPDASIRNFNNSMIFTGKIKANEAGVYTFVSNSDDDGYLYVDGQLVSYDPGGHGQQDATKVVPISLAAGSTHDFVFLVNQGGGGEGAHIEWVTPSMAAANPAATPVIVPNTNLTSAIGTPSQPTGLVVSGTPGSNSVDFTFSSDNNAVVHYLLQRSTDGSNWVNVAQTNPSSGFGLGSTNSIPIADASANPSSTYQYRVVAMNFDHTSTPSSPVTVSTAAATQGPGVEVHYYNGEIASQTSGQDPHNFAVNGLPAEFQSLDFQSVNQSFPASPDATLYTDTQRVNPYSFASVYTGQIVTDGAGMYTFVTNTSDDGYLFVNGVLVSSDPGTHAVRNATTLTPVSLAANTAYNFVFIQQEVNNGIGSAAPAGAVLQWIEPGQTSPAVIPAVSGTLGGLEKLMSVPDKQVLDAAGHVTETPGASAAGNVTAAGAPGGGIALTWTDQGLSQLWFEVQRATSASGPFTTIGSAGFNATAFTDATAVAGTHYYYRVRGANFDATGPFSNTADAIATAATQTIVGTAGNDTITLRVDSTDPTKDDVWINVPTSGAPTEQVSNGQTIVISGGGVATGGTDTLVIDSSNGNPVPTGAAGTVLRLDSGTGNFTLSGSLPTLDASHVVDLGKSTLNIPYTGTSPLSTIQAALKNGFLKSTDAAGSSGKFGIADVDTGSQVALSYRVIGDLNGDGSVNFNDLLALAQNYNTSGKDWSKGDLTYDGSVNFNDLLALAQHYGQTAAAAPAAAAASQPLAAASNDLLTGKKSRKH